MIEHQPHCTVVMDISGCMAYMAEWSYTHIWCSI